MVLFVCFLEKNDETFLQCRVVGGETLLSSFNFLLSHLLFMEKKQS